MDFSLLIPLIAISIPVVAILSGTAKRYIAMKEKQLDAQTRPPRRPRNMRRRSSGWSSACALERIVTDKGGVDEIESLRDTPLN